MKTRAYIIIYCCCLEQDQMQKLPVPSSPLPSRKQTSWNNKLNSLKRKSQKEAAAALAEAQAWEASVQESEPPQQPQLYNMQQNNPTERVKEYLWQQWELCDDDLSAQYEQQPRVQLWMTVSK